MQHQLRQARPTAPAPNKRATQNQTFGLRRPNGEYGPIALFPVDCPKVRFVRIPVITKRRSERPQSRTFDFCSISASATGIEVFRSPCWKA
ncbi:hypothetical protein M1105_15255 [Limibaculum sp. FT325]|uniref:hypothetical protein n=1 Tax=Thermohalobaculum sediminis TaxID=2939436 RepID=UPI0020C188BF|nr:hypothetical protein [Limibaculum sediminis]MCL5778338.1 hypothetical protein [Limibaculum sediminis]